MVSTAFSSSPFHPAHSQSRSASQTSTKMSITQTYFLAHKARAKLSNEAARADHNLRLLVGHANLLDSLMLDLADAEREQESWFNQSVRGASNNTKSSDRHVQWADSIVEEEDWEGESSDSDSDFDDDEDEEDIEMADAIPLRRIQSTTPASPKMAAMELEDDDEEEDFESLTLTRTPSHAASPPELDHDVDSSDDESMPPSPPTASFPAFAEESTRKQRDTTVTTTPLFDTKDEDEDVHHHKTEFYSEGFYLPPRNPARLVSTISVY